MSQNIQSIKRQKVTKKDLVIGTWVIWPNDTISHPRQIIGLSSNGRKYKINILGAKGKYVTDRELCEEWQLLAAKLCTPQEIPYGQENYNIY